MMLSKLSYGAMCCIFCVFISCDFSPDDTKPNTDDQTENGVISVSADLVWSRKSGSFDSQPMLINDGVLYYAERDLIDGYTACNPETGEIIWQDKNRGSSTCLPVFFENGRVGYITGNNLFIFNLNGSLYKHIQMDGDGFLPASEPGASGSVFSYASKDYGLVCFDIEADVEKKGSIYTVTPKILYPNPPDEDEDDDIRWIPPLIKDGVIYSGVNAVWGKPGTFFAIDLSTNKVLWESGSVDDGTSLNGLQSWSYWPPSYVDGNLLFLDPYGFGKIHAGTGKMLVDQGVYYAGGKDSGGFFYDGKIYYSSSSDASNEDNPNNVKCIDIDTGSSVWMNSFEGSHGSNPVCYEGITYVFSQNCLRMLDAQTGKQLGIDINVHGDIWQVANIVAYKDLAIVKYKDIIFAVKMNFKTDGKGKLWKVQ